MPPEDTLNLKKSSSILHFIQTQNFHKQGGTFFA